MPVSDGFRQLNILRAVTLATSLFGFVLLSNAASITPLGTFPGEDQLGNYALELSQNGTFVVGLGLELNVDIHSPPPTFESVGFVWSSESGTQQIGAIEQKAYPTGVSNDGRTISVTFVSVDGSNDAGIWQEGSINSLPGAPPSFGKRARDLSADGSAVVGTKPNAQQGYDEATIWTTSGPIGLGVPPGARPFSSGYSISGDGDLVVGNSSSGLFLWSATTGLTVLDPRGSSDGPIISSNGKYVAASVEQFSKGRLWDLASTDAPLDFLVENHRIDVRSVDNSGTVIGNLSEDGISQAIAWRKDTGFIDIQELLVGEHGLEAELAGWDLDGEFGGIEDISADGKVIIGNGVNPVGLREGWVIRLDRPLLVPEPTSCAGMILSLVILGTIASGRPVAQ